MADNTDADLEDLPTHSSSSVPTGNGPTSLPSTSSLPDLSSTTGGGGKEKKKKKVRTPERDIFIFCCVLYGPTKSKQGIKALYFTFQKLGTGLAMKKKGVGNLVQKWQQIQEEVATKQKD